ncbi:MAG TPA: phosphoglucosamine mutase [Bacteroidales bacterium]|nr:phosphoglucosamine mutase [Bacteroidales bacterium]
MTLIKSISGIRGTIGGYPGDNLTPIDVVKFTAAYGTFIKQKVGNRRCKVVVGRDARISGAMVEQLVCATLVGLGIDVVNAGMATTPTVEVAVVEVGADGGIILTASHNPKQWNALKLLNAAGEFISAAEGQIILDIATRESFVFASVDELGQMTTTSFDEVHIQKILALPLVNTEAIRAAELTVAIDAVNSVGGIVVPALLKALGVKNILPLYCTPDGHFPHNPEPLPEHLTDISRLVVEKKAHLGFVVDPDVDRLAIVCEDGSMFGEEYTLVAVADYVLRKTPGNTVSNLSSSRALKDVTEKYGYQYFASAVGEVNVVEKMKQVNAIIGGEGNGGVIYPALHYGRDALVGIALFLSHLAESKMSCSELRKKYPNYVISKNKIELTPGIDLDRILAAVKDEYKQYPQNDSDGLRIDFENEWVHLRRSNTEPIIRVYAESANAESAAKLANKVIDKVKALAGLN